MKTASTLTLSALALCAFARDARAQNCPANVAYPAQEWTSTADSIRASRAAQIQALEDYAFTLTGADSERKGVRTDGVVIIQHGQLIYEKYARGWTAEMPHNSWSVTKSVTNALTGVAVAQGRVRINQPICDFVTAARAENCAITVQNLLEFASGLQWQEVYEDESNQASSVLAMLYGVGRRDLVQFVTNHPRQSAPGTVYRYSTGDSSLLASVVNRAMQNAGNDEDWPWTQLFEPLGMSSVTLESDASGNPVGGSWFYATPRDMARFGYLLLHDGCWQTRRILPENWVRDSTTVSAPFMMARLETEDGDVQGRQFWLNRVVPTIQPTLPWTGVPDDAFAARGHWGQSITVIPSRDVVIVRVGDDRASPRPLDFGRFLSLALAVAP